MPAYRPIKQRIQESIIIDENGCWIWQLAKYHTGYGAMRVSRRTITAHRVAYEEYVGPIPDGLVLDHLCRIPACVNPAHLEPVTNGENVRRGLAGRELNGGYCRNGLHVIASEADLTGNGKQCRMCVNDGARQRAAVKRGQQPVKAKIKGEAHPLARLSDADVVAIRERNAAGETLRIIASDYNISLSTVSLLALGKSRPEAGGPIRDKRFRKGVDSYNAKLTEEDVRAIRAAERTRGLAAKYGISREEVRDIRSRKRWKHLD